MGARSKVVLVCHVRVLPFTGLQCNTQTRAESLYGVDVSTSPRPDQLKMAVDVAQAGAVPEQPKRLSRRNREVIVDADFFAEDHGVVWFIRRGHGGEPVDETYTFVRSAGGWTSPGGGGGTPGADLEKRPALAEIAAWNEKIRFMDACDFAMVGGGSSRIRWSTGLSSASRCARGS